jgi:hypothetical protein
MSITPTYEEFASSTIPYGLPPIEMVNVAIPCGSPTSANGTESGVLGIVMNDQSETVGLEVFAVGRTATPT